MMERPDARLGAAAAFGLRGPRARIEPLGNGHIHETWRVDAGPGPVRGVLQRLNIRVFPDPEAVMENLVRVTEHRRRALLRAGCAEPERRGLALLRTEDGDAWLRDADGFWRAFHLVDDAYTLSHGADPERARAAARAFGAFAADLADLPGPPLRETIPHFHDLPKRAADLEAAARADARGRAAGAARELDAAREWATRIGAELAALPALPRRAVHNDCKLDNVLFCRRSHAALCVIDLDTVMDGTLLCDFGELVRTTACAAPEDAVHTAGAEVDRELLRALARGYLEGAAPLATEAEREALWLAGPLLTVENAVRFLTDHLEGDTYFRVHREAHNLERARSQLHLAELLLAEADTLRAAVANAARETATPPQF